MSLWGAAGVGTRGRRQSELREEVPLRLLRRTALTRIVDEQQGMEPKVRLWTVMVSPDSRLGLSQCGLLPSLSWTGLKYLIIRRHKSYIYQMRAHHFVH